jgi:hypothetical protein
VGRRKRGRETEEVLDKLDFAGSEDGERGHSQEMQVLNKS